MWTPPHSRTSSSDSSEAHFGTILNVNIWSSNQKWSLLTWILTMPPQNCKLTQLQTLQSFQNRNGWKLASIDSNVLHKQQLLLPINQWNLKENFTVTCSSTTTSNQTKFLFQMIIWISLKSISLINLISGAHHSTKSANLSWKMITHQISLHIRQSKNKIKGIPIEVFMLGNLSWLKTRISRKFNVTKYIHTSLKSRKKNP